MLLQKCERCKRPIADGEIGVVAPKFGDDVLWHPACFTCDSCKELLVDLTYCVHDEDIFCERHYAEKLKPRCSSCDEVRRSELFLLLIKTWSNTVLCAHKEGKWIKLKIDFRRTILKRISILV